MPASTEQPAGTERTSANRSRSERSSPPAYGYHNTFHTHAPPTPDTLPPTYACAISEKTLGRLSDIAQAERLPACLPGYTCTVQNEGVLGLKQELSTPFQVAGTREWNDAYVVLQGTQLRIHKVKSPKLLSRNPSPSAGRLVKSFTLQHAEVGLAADFKKTSLIPKSAFAHLVPTSARAKLYETDPHLFEPVREHVIRLRLETEQFLLCASSHESMLDWVEKLCAAIDISPPIEDRSEPRYRSLPRRNRRQRVIDSARLGANLEDLSSVDIGRRIIAEQERIIRQLYPHLAAGQPNSENSATQSGGDPETDDLDPDDVRFPTSRRITSQYSQMENELRPSTAHSIADPKHRPAHQHNPAQALRYRRRCAPILLASSPRVSDVVYSEGKRLRINVKERILVEYTSHPPRYDAHSFPKKAKALPTITERVVPKSVPAPIHIERPASPMRGVSEDSFMSFGYDLAASSSEQPPHPESDSDDIRIASSEPPSPTALTHAKADAAHKFASMAKARASDEGMNTVALGVGLLV